MTEPDTKDEIKSPEDSQESSSVWKRLSMLNQPFAVTVAGGVIVFLVTSSMQFWYWRAQQDYLFQQESMKFRLSAIDETIKSVDELLAADAAEFTAYKSNFRQDQKNEVDDERDAAVKDWDKESDLRKLRIQLYFPDPAIQKLWKQVEDDDLGTLDCYIMRLGTNELPNGCDELHLTNVSQNALIAKGLPFVERTQEDLRSLAKLMVDWASKPRQASIPSQ